MVDTAVERSHGWRAGHPLDQPLVKAAHHVFDTDATIMRALQQPTTSRDFQFDPIRKEDVGDMLPPLLAGRNWNKPKITVASLSSSLLKHRVGRMALLLFMHSFSLFGYLFVAQWKITAAPFLWQVFYDLAAHSFLHAPLYRWQTTADNVISLESWQSILRIYFGVFYNLFVFFIIFYRI